MSRGVVLGRRIKQKLRIKKMDNNDLRVKHLEFIRDVIDRMGQNSFLIKGWGITLIAAIFAVAVIKEVSWVFILIGLLPAIAFWGLDSYFLWQERLFRELYKDVSKYFSNSDSEDVPELFSMSTEPHMNKNYYTCYWKAFSSLTILCFYAPIILLIIVLAFICRYFGG